MQAVLQAVRAAIQQALPKAQESISYQMPTYKLGGRAVIYFAAWKKHYAIYPATVALVEAFRAHGIYPRDVRNLSIDSLRWAVQPEEKGVPAFLQFVKEVPSIKLPPDLMKQLGLTQKNWFRDGLLAWDLRSDRENIGNQQHLLRRALHIWIARRKDLMRGILKGIDLDGMKFEVHSLRPARRVGPDGEQLADMVIEITQQRGEYIDPAAAGRPDARPDFKFRGGATLIVDLETYKIRYYINKSIDSRQRLERQRMFLGGDDDGSLRALYFGSRLQSEMREPFAFLHRASGEEEML